MSDTTRTQGTWKKPTHFLCACHDEPVRMIIRSGPNGDYFYACPRYFLKDMMHPDGHDKNEPMCTNRLSFQDSQKIIEACTKTCEQELLSGGSFPSFYGMQGKLSNGVTYIVTKDTPASFVSEGEREICVKNVRALRS